MALTIQSVWNAIQELINQDIFTITGNGVPTSGGSGTGNGITGKGSTYIDFNTGIKYVNTNTKASPTWTEQVSTTATQTLTNKTLTTPVIGAATGTSLAATGAITSNGGAGSGIGYATGAGGTVTQATSKSTGVTLSEPTGQITMNNAALAADAIVSFVLTNTFIAANDFLLLNHLSAGTPGSYSLNARCAAGSATIDVANRSAGSLSEAIVIQFMLFKGVIT